MGEGEFQERSVSSDCTFSMHEAELTDLNTVYRSALFPCMWLSLREEKGRVPEKTRFSSLFDQSHLPNVL